MADVKKKKVGPVQAGPEDLDWIRDQVHQLKKIGKMTQPMLVHMLIERFRQTETGKPSLEITAKPKPLFNPDYARLHEAIEVDPSARKAVEAVLEAREAAAPRKPVRAK